MGWRPLAGVRVLDLSRLLPGPFLSQVLNDLGADVVKVEEPGTGDYARWIPPTVEGHGYAFAAVNRGKRSLALDLKAPGASDVVLRLAARSDVLLESFRPGVLERLGLADALLERANPRLVRLSLVGYPRGPMRDEAGHDINYEALAGVLEGPEQPRGVLVADVAGALYGAAAVLAALHERERTGRGRHVDVALADAALAFNTIDLARGAVGLAGPSELAGGIPGYRVYRTRDGGAVALGALEPKFWERFVQAVGRSDLDALHLDADGIAAVERVFLERDRDDWVALLRKAGVPATPVLTAAESASAHADRLGPGAPLTHEATSGRVPELGEHTLDILAEAGFTPDEVERLRRARVVR